MEQLLIAILAAQQTTRPTVSGILLLVLPICLFVAIALRMWMIRHNKRK